MINLMLKAASDRPLNVLCLGCHADDIEIGCGGTILRLRRQYPSLRLHWVVFSAIGVRKEEARRGAQLFAGPDGPEQLLLREFPDGFMPYVGGEVKKFFEDLKQTVSPDLILTHNRHDAHQDHRLICELTWNTFRNHFILEYEIPKYDGDLGQPSVFVPLDEDLPRVKTACLHEAFGSQRSKHWFDESTFLALMRLRGMECNAPGGYAEAFYCRKIVL